MIRIIMQGVDKSRVAFPVCGLDYVNSLQFADCSKLDAFDHHQCCKSQ